MDDFLDELLIMLRFSIVNILLLLSLFFIACRDLVSTESSLFPITLVRHSVLDQKPRMLTLQFGEERFAVYDLAKAQLEKVWRGGVLWNGAAFNDMKTIQPESYGQSYWEYKNHPLEWLIEKSGTQNNAEIKYTGHTSYESDFRIHYALNDGHGNEVKLAEYPKLDYIDGELFYEREFRIIENKDNVNILLNGIALAPFDLPYPLRKGEGHLLKMEFDTLSSTPQPAASVSTNSSQYWLDRSGCNTCHYQSKKMIGPSYETIAGQYDDNSETVNQLVQSVKNGSSGKWGTTAMIPHPNLGEDDIERMIKYILSLRPASESAALNQRKTSSKVAQKEKVKVPGFGEPLEGVHPAYDLIPIRPSWFKPRVGGMVFKTNENLLLSTWDAEGAVYEISGLATNDTNQIQIQQIASGLSEPLGLTTVGDDIFVLQKHELTQLLDHNKDRIVDEYKVINNSFGVTADFHEFSYGLVYKDGYFYGGLGLAMRLMSSELQLPDRGTIFKIGMDGSYEVIATGLRQPNGIGLGSNGEIFVTENQGQWSPACKIIHIEAGKFYACQFGTGDRYINETETPPAVWLPQDEIGNSPSQPLLMQDGPYKGQMIFGEVTHGGIKRAFLESINGKFQGCVFRFTQGLEAGINRMAWGPDGGLYVGGVGMNGNWAHQGNQYGLQKLVFNGNIPFELLAIRAMKDGFELEFTHPISSDAIEQHIGIQQWYYKTTAAYGGPKLDLHNLDITSVKYSNNRKKIQLQMPNLKKGYVIHFRLSPNLKSEKGSILWSGDAWYTLNEIPDQPLIGSGEVIQ